MITRVARSMALLMALLSLLPLVSGCTGPQTPGPRSLGSQPPPSPEGSWTAREAEVLQLADEIVGEEFPDMVDAQRTLDTYTSSGREFYEVTYSKAVQAQGEGGLVELPRIVVVTIDRNTGERIVEVSQ